MQKLIVLMLIVLALAESRRRRRLRRRQTQGEDSTATQNPCDGNVGDGQTKCTVTQENDGVCTKNKDTNVVECQVPPNKDGSGRRRRLRRRQTQGEDSTATQNPCDGNVGDGQTKCTVTQENDGVCTKNKDTNVVECQVPPNKDESRRRRRLRRRQTQGEDSTATQNPCDGNVGDGQTKCTVTQENDGVCTKNKDTNVVECQVPNNDESRRRRRLRRRRLRRRHH